MTYRDNRGIVDSLVYPLRHVPEISHPPPAMAHITSLSPARLLPFVNLQIPICPPISFSTANPVISVSIDRRTGRRITYSFGIPGYLSVVPDSLVRSSRILFWTALEASRLAVFHTIIQILSWITGVSDLASEVSAHRISAHRIFR